MKLIYKHSPTCIVSLKAKLEVNKVLKKYGQNLDYEFVDVTQERGRSDEIAGTYDIRHESPQVIIVDEKKEPVWYASHFEITSKKISGILDELVEQ